MEREKNKDKIKDFKTGLKDNDKNFERHFKAKTKITQDKREKRLELKRRNKEEDIPIPTDNIIELIKTFPIQQFLNEQQPTNIVKTLLHVLKTQDIEYYYAPSRSYSNQTNGPYLFQNDNVIIKLISLLETTKDIPLLTNVSHCLICISAHPENLVWTGKLIRYNTIQSTMKLLEHCPDVTVRDNLIWMLANIMLDGSLAKNSVVEIGKQKLIELVCKSLKHDKKIKSTSIFFLYAITREIPLVDFQIVEPLWNIILNDVFINSYREEGDLDNDYQIILHLLSHICIQNNADDYRHSICYNNNVMERLLKPINQKNIMELIKSADIIDSLTVNKDLHDRLIKNRVLEFFVFLIDNHDPRLRILGVSGLKVMATNKFAIDYLIKDHVLITIMKHFEYSKQGNIQVQLKLLIAQMVITVSKMGMPSEYYPKLLDKDVHRRIICIIPEQHDMNLLYIGLSALKELVKYNKKLMKELIEDIGYMDKLETISFNHRDKGIIDITESILNILGFNTMDMDLDD